MSHFAEMRVDCQVKNEKDLIDALKEMFGANGVDVCDPARGLTGMDRNKTRKANIIVKQDAFRKMNRPGYNEMGFERKTDGSYALHVDHMDFTKDMSNGFFQDYSRRVAERKLKAQGYQVKRVLLDNGDIELTATKP